MTYLTKSILRSLCLGAILAGVAGGQLLYDEEEDYVNYARQGYRPYTGGVWSELRRPVFDELGNYMMQGVDIYRTEEGREDDPLAGSLINKSNEYRINLNRLVIGHDTYGDWSSRLMVGDQIRTKFSALTLDLANLNGVRWDIDLNPTKITLVSSRIDYPVFASGGFSGATTVRSERDNELNGPQRWATYLLGGHVERQIGALNLGFNYVNLHRTDSLVDWGDNSVKGILPSAVNMAPALIAVKVADGSDRDGRGARVYDMRIVGDLADIRPEVTRHDADLLDQTYPNNDQFFPPGREIPPYVQYLKGEFPPELPNRDGYIEASGTEYLVFWFRIPQDLRDQVEELQFEALIADDYHVELSEVFLAISREVSAIGAQAGDVRATYFYEVAGSEGRVSDQSNLRWVRFKYGRQTGRTLTSLRMEFERPGLELTAEFARNWNFLQYPTPLGRRKWNSSASNGYFVNFKKQLPGLALGGELFRLDPLYSTTLSVADANYSLYTDDLESPFSIFPSFPAARNNTVDLSTVDDNDDKDLAPDFHFLPHLADGSVIPGRDIDQNGRIDSNENGNLIPDYLEPFLLYDSNPPEFDYGDDLNNNGILDHREDDTKPDYPYDADLEGWHLFGDVEPAPALTLRFGKYRAEEIWGGGVNDVTYLRADYERAVYPLGRFEVSNYLKRVEDDIANDTPQLTTFAPNQVPVSPGFVLPVNAVLLVEDELSMRNSVVNTAFVDATIFRVDDLNLNARIKQGLNFQRETSYQPANTIRDWTVVLRADYTWRRGRLAVSPKVKYMLYDRGDDEDRLYPVAERYFYPMLVAQYELTPQTEVSAGAQGFPFLKSTFRDRNHRDSDYSSRDYIVSMTNRTTYQGQYLSLNMGYHLQVVEYDDGRREGEKIDRALFFLRLVLGLEPFSG